MSPFPPARTAALVKVSSGAIFHSEKFRTMVSHGVIYSSQFAALIAPFLEKVMQMTPD